MAPASQTEKRRQCECMVIVKATKDSEAGVYRRRAGDRDDEVQRGAGEGGDHARGRWAEPELGRQAREVQRASAQSSTDPFAETKELIAGYWLWQVKSMEEAVEWVKRCPNPMPGESEMRSAVFEARTFRKRRPRSWQRKRSSVRRSPLARIDDRSGGVCIVASASCWDRDGRCPRLEENAGAIDVRLTPEELEEMCGCRPRGSHGQSVPRVRRS